MTHSEKPYLVVGLGKSGQAVIDFFISRGIACHGFDENKEVINRCEKKIPLHTKIPDLDYCGLIVSPGVPLTQKWIQEASIPIIGELELASRYLKGPMIGVTGTNGKSTTVSLIHEILGQGGKQSSLKGNIGSPLIEAVSEPVQDYYVVEVSSYQLETVSTFHPKISVLLNVTEDHLERYENMAAYARAKERITENQGKDDFFIYNADDPACSRMAKHCRAQVLPFSLVNPVARGGFVQRNSMVVRLDREEIYPLSECSLKGIHNQENMLASTLVSRCAGISESSIRQTLQTFRGLSHRMEFVGKHHGMDVYNDSKATNVGATVMALASFEKGVVLILGGRDKGGSYAPLKSLICAKVDRLILLGEARKILEKEFQKFHPESVETVREAVALAFKHGKSGQTLLFSPACSSYDQYHNFEERGDDFKKWIHL